MAWFDLEDPADLTRLQDPGLELRPLRGLVVLDEIHWSTHTGAGLDLLVMAGSRRYGFEVKRSEAPRLTKSMRSALETLRLDRLDVVHAGTDRYRLAAGVRALPARELVGTLRAFPGG